MNKGCLFRFIRLKTAVGSGQAPTNQIKPSISGTLVIGNTLFASPGQWLGGPSFAPAVWKRYDPATGLTTNTGVTGASYLLGAADVGKQLRVEFTGTNINGSLTVSSDLSVVVVTPSLPGSPTNQGRTAGYTAYTPGVGTQPDIIVDPAGTGNFTTLKAALATNPVGKWIHCKSGREYAPFGGIAVTSDGVHISANQDFTVSGGMPLTALSQCSAADAAVVGSSYASIYKQVVAVDTTGANANAIHHNAFNALLVTEDDAPLDIVTRRHDETNLFEQSDDGAFFRSSTGSDGKGTENLTIGVDANGYATTVTHAAVLGVGTWTDAQLANAAVMMLVGSNTPAVMNVASASGGVLTLENPINAKTGLPSYKPDLSPSGGAYALLNIGPYIKQGQWFYVDNGDNTLTVYVWPNNPANIAAKIEVAREKVAFHVTAANVSSDGLLFTHTADGTTGNACVHIDFADNCRLKEFKIYNTSHAYKGYGGLLVESSMGFVASNFEIDKLQNQYGLFIKGSRPLPINGNTAYRAAETQNARIYNFVISNCSQTATRIYSSWNVAFWNFLILSCGKAAHANLGNGYEGCDNLVWAQGEWRDCDGYLTWQEASNVYVINCLVPCDRQATSGGGRGIYDQNHSSDNGPTVPSGLYVINCAVPRRTSAYHGYAALTMGQPYGSTTSYVYNTVADGITTLGGPLVADNNITTMLVSSTNAQFPLRGANDVSTTQAAIYYDPSNDNWKAASGSIINTKAGKDVSAIISNLESIMPDVPLRRSLGGAAWDPATPSVGPWGGALAVGP